MHCINALYKEQPVFNRKIDLLCECVFLLLFAGLLSSKSVHSNTGAITEYIWRLLEDDMGAGLLCYRDVNQGRGGRKGKLLLLLDLFFLSCIPSCFILFIFSITRCAYSFELWSDFLLVLQCKWQIYYDICFFIFIVVVFLVSE